jgi:membrane associated rhomboid family serine protease
MKRLLVLTALALVAALIFAPAVLAQEETTLMTTATPGLPPTGGISGSGFALMAAALLLGAGIVSAAVVRRRP